MEIKNIEYFNIQLIDGDRGHNYPKQDELLPEGDCLFLSAKNVTKSGFIFTDNAFITKSKDQVLRAGKMNHFDIVITTRGTIGNVGYFESTIPYENIRINSGMMMLRADKREWNTYFLYSILCSDFFQNQIKSFISGSAVPQLPKKDLQKMKLPVIDLSKQDKFAKILKSFDDKIQLNTDTNRTLEQIAQAVFQHWFIDFAPVRAKAQARAQGKNAVEIERAAMMSLSGKTADELTALATRNPTAYTDLKTLAIAFPDELTTTEHGEVPKGWELVPLIELFTFIGGAQPPKSEHIYEKKEGYVRFVQNRDYANENHKTFIPISKKNKLCNEKDILMDKYGEAGKVRFGIGGAYNVALAKIEPKQPELREYLRWHFMQKTTQGYLSAASMASTRSSLNSKTFTGMMICVPPEAILSEFNRIATDYINFSLHVKKENASLENIRDVLLPELLSGEVKL